MKAAAVFLLAAIAVATGPAAAAEPSAVAELVDVTNRVCHSQATDPLGFDGTPDQDEQFMKANKLAYGLSPGTLERFGPDAQGILSRSIMGSRESGGDLIVLSIGGAFSRCKTMLLSPTDEAVGDEAASAFASSSLRWKEAPATNTPGAPLQKRMFISRDEAGQAYLLNMFTTTVPNSQLRLLTTVNLIPANVELPEGF